MINKQILLEVMQENRQEVMRHKVFCIFNRQFLAT